MSKHMYISRYFDFIQRNVDVIYWNIFLISVDFTQATGALGNGLLFCLNGEGG